jgi:hypothetical protein
MDSLARVDGLVYVGMDTSKETIAVAVLSPGVEKPVTDVIANDEPAIRHYFGRCAEPARLRACYEAGRPGSACTGC